MAKKKVQKGVGQKVVDQSARDEADAQWKEIGLDSTARQALVEAKLLKVSDLKSQFRKIEATSWHWCK